MREIVLWRSVAFREGGRARIDIAIDGRFIDQRPVMLANGQKLVIQQEGSLTTVIAFGPETVEEG